MRLRHLAAATLLAALATVPAAADQLMTFTYSTTALSESVDGAGLFGVPGANLGGDPVMLVFTVDLNLGTTPSSSHFQTDLQSGYTFNLSSLNVSAAITVNGHTFHSAPSTDNVGVSSFQENTVGGVPTQLVLYEQSGNFNCDDRAAGACLPFVFPNETSAFRENFGITSNTGGFSYTVNPPHGSGNPSLYTSVYTAETAPIVTIGATPEPSSLVLLGTGIIAFAGAQRRSFNLKRG